MAYHEWPAIIDDTVIGYAAVGNESGTYINHVDFNTPVYTKIDWKTIKESPNSPHGRFENGRLLTVLGAYSFPVYDETETASTVSCPHYNPWYGGLEYHENPKQGDPGWESQRNALFDAIRRSIEAGLPVCAGFVPAHAVIIEGYKEENGVPSALCNMGWGGSMTWSSRTSEPVGRNNALSGIFAMHAPRKMAQVEPLPAVSGPKQTIRWYAPKYWKEIAPEAEQITGYRVEVSEAASEATTWRDDFSQLKQDCLLRNMCGCSDKDRDPHTQDREMIRLVKENSQNQLWIHNCADPRYYEWPESWVATKDSRLTFSADIAYTMHMDGLIQIKVANQPWQTLADLTERGVTDNTDQGWKDYSVSLGEFSGQAFKLRIYTARRMRGGYLNYESWKFANWTLSAVRTFGNTKTAVEGPAVFEKTLDLDVGKTYEIAVKPVFDDGVGQCHRTATTTVRANAPDRSAITVTYRDEEPADDLAFVCAHSDSNVLTVKTSRPTVDLKAISGNTSIYPEDAISVEQVDETTWTVTLTPTERFTTYVKYSNGQRLLLTLAAIDSDGTAAYRDLSLTFDKRYNTRGSGGSADTTLTAEDFYRESDPEEWVLTVGDAFEKESWQTLEFTRGGERKTGAELSASDKVRIEVTAKTPQKAWPYYRRVLFESSCSVASLTVVFADGGNQDLGFAFDGVHYFTTDLLCVAGAGVRLDRCVRPGKLWIGYEGKVMTAPVYLEKCESVSGVGTLNLTQLGADPIEEMVDLSNFKGYVTGAETITPLVVPTPDKIDGGNAPVVVNPGMSVEVSASTADEAERSAALAVADEDAAAAGQAELLKLVATRKEDTGNWVLSVAIDPEKMPAGKKLDDTLAAVVGELGSLAMQTTARAPAMLVIPSDNVTPGLYYSVLYADGLDFSEATESARVLATGGDVRLMIPSDGGAKRFFKVRASMTPNND